MCVWSLYLNQSSATQRFCLDCTKLEQRGIAAAPRELAEVGILLYTLACKNKESTGR